MPSTHDCDVICSWGTESSTYNYLLYSYYCSSCDCALAEILNNVIIQRYGIVVISPIKKKKDNL